MNKYSAALDRLEKTLTSQANIAVILATINDGKHVIKAYEQENPEASIYIILTQFSDVPDQIISRFTF